LYDMTLSVEFLKFLRPERRFERIDELVQQMRQDAAAAQEALQMRVLTPR
ncbi:MAG: hypothetical protein H5T69_02805, partial [Chloroflexi bacterium]|nr:hypothetical protein [Chloroflexota bacterium]